MSEIEVINHRLDALEKDVKVLYKKINEVTLTQVQTVTKLDSMLVTLVELKESIESIKKRPSWLWDKILVALISAICGVLISNII
jgi:predicted mannosyl-3-phosphoglycerate phosphatase (HAD superfamily)